MKQLNEDLYVIEEGLYAERRGTEWFTSNEQSEVLAGPFATLEAVQADHDGAVANYEGAVAAVEARDELMTLRQAAKRLPVSSQALYALRSRGGLPEPRRIASSPTTPTGEVALYSLADLAKVFEGKTHAERTSEGARRGWAKLTPEQRAARIAKIQEGKNR